jgi:hypothetical protein
VDIGAGRGWRGQRRWRGRVGEDDDPLGVGHGSGGGEAAGGGRECEGVCEGVCKECLCLVMGAAGAARGRGSWIRTDLAWCLGCGQGRAEQSRAARCCRRGLSSSSSSSCGRGSCAPAVLLPPYLYLVAVAVAAVTAVTRLLLALPWKRQAGRGLVERSPPLL